MCVELQIVEFLIVSRTTINGVEIVAIIIVKRNVVPPLNAAALPYKPTFINILLLSINRCALLFSKMHDLNHLI